MTTTRKPVTFWCHYCRPVREFVGTKCLTQLITHWTAWHDPTSPFNTRVSPVKQIVDMARTMQEEA